MAGLHHANTSKEIEDPILVARNSRVGLRLFWSYVLFYGSYVLINTFAPTWMEWTPVMGLNLAILWGFGLIVLAVVLAFLYGWICSRGRAATNPKGGES